VDRAPIVWRLATVTDIVAETAHAKTVVFEVAGMPAHVPGQYVDVRLTAEDGYQAQRSYSIASAPAAGRLALTVERIDAGEVSPYLTEELRRGDQIELRGPIGGPFTWSVARGGPLLLAAGGSGIVPLMSMLRHRAALSSTIATTLLVSSRGWDDILYREELGLLGTTEGLAVHHTLTRSQPRGWDGFSGRVDAPMLTAVGPAPGLAPLAFVCGPTPFVEHVADLLVALGHDPAAVRTERFGPTGG